MGKEDLTVNRLLERPAIFADLVNGSFYKGEQVIEAKELIPQFTTEQITYEKKDGTIKGIKRMRDIKMKTRLGTFSVMFAAETQNNVHYAMPLRNMLYDTIGYVKQVEDMEKEHIDANEKLSGDEFLSGITKEDRLEPIMNMVLFLGNEWDGPKSLREMMRISDKSDEMKKLLEYLPDYKIKLISAETIEDPKWFRSCLQYIFSMLKLKKDKKALYQYMLEHRKELMNMDRVEKQATMALFGEGRRLRKIFEDEKGEEDMAGVFTEMIEEIAAELANERAEKLANEWANEWANERAEKLANERAEKMANERAEKMANERAEKIVKERIGEVVSKAEHKTNLLMQKLLFAKRYNDLERITREPDFKAELFREFQISDND